MAHDLALRQPELTMSDEPPLRHTIIVYLPDFDENSGGSIVLHMLVHQLRELGHAAYGYKWLPPIQPKTPVRQFWSHSWRRLRGRDRKLPSRLNTHPTLNVPQADPAMVADAIVMYPEVVVGNPLNATRVLRWFLNKPGAFGHNHGFGRDDLVFVYQEAFADGIPGVDAANILRVRWLRHDVYVNRNLPGRTGNCRLIRKGTPAGPTAIPPEDAAILLDGMSHIDMAQVFNRTNLMLCHDPYTMYVYYAALCGCVPVVLPQPGLTAADWRGSFEIKHGVAYGEDEIDWARATRADLLADMDAAAAAELDNVRDFVRKLALHFG